MNMLEHQKLILENVKYDKNLFSKELSKSLKWLSQEETILLQEWCLEKYNGEFNQIIRKVFETEAA